MTDEFEDSLCQVDDPKDDKQAQEFYWSRTDRPRWIAALFCGTGALYATRITMPLCVTSIAQDTGWNKQDQGLVLSTFFWGYLISQIPAGWLSDVYGGEIIALYAILGGSLSTMAVPFVLYFPLAFLPPIVLVVACRIFLGISQGLFYPALTSLVAKRIPVTDRSYGNAAAVAGGPIGSLLMGSIGSVILSNVGWSWDFYIFGLLGFFWCMIWRYWFVSSLPAYTKMTHVNDHQLISGEGTKSLRSAIPWNKLLRQPAIWAIVITHVCHNCMYFTLLSWLPTYFHENFPDAKGWVFNVVPFAANFVGKVSGGYIADSLIRSGYSVGFVRKLLEALGTTGPALMLLVTMYTTQFWQALVCMSLALGISGLETSGCHVNMQDIAPKYAGSICGLVYAIGAIPGIVGVYVTGYILHLTGSWSVVFQINIIICIFGTTVYCIFGTGRKVI